MPERDRSLPTPEQNPTTLFKRPMLGKQTPRTRDAYATDLRDFARFLGINSYQDVHPLATVPDNAWQQLGHHKAHYANRMNSNHLYFEEANTQFLLTTVRTVTFLFLTRNTANGQNCIAPRMQNTD